LRPEDRTEVKVEEDNERRFTSSSECRFGVSHSSIGVDTGHQDKEVQSTLVLEKRLTQRTGERGVYQHHVTKAETLSAFQNLSNYSKTAYLAKTSGRRGRLRGDKERKKRKGREKKRKS
jgi:hypothetical protein